MARLLTVKGKAGATEFKITDLVDEPRQAQAPVDAQVLSDHGDESAEEAAQSDSPYHSAGPAPSDDDDGKDSGADGAGHDD